MLIACTKINTSSITRNNTSHSTIRKIKIPFIIIPKNVIFRNRSKERCASLLYWKLQSIPEKDKEDTNRER